MASVSSSGTKWIAVLLRYLARLRSTQLYEALSSPPTNHFQNGGLEKSSVLSHGLYQVSMSAYSLKHSGKFFSPKRSRTSLSFMFACAMNSAGG